ncbi:AAA family ATPase [Geomonas nitrogeniifigens]|uniref:ATP-dependent DNA helicase n=1 Tax=Geomonas diazotrophica TaxID=2843197 RepID=UPI001C2BB298|nr:DEAD/DEAH box helicase [Geomonas nitrogeniifigens]QXE87363.1 AAA family ATPase [Geomonas nitrogeniifigens]
MDPFSLLALVTAAGFVFSKVSSQSKENNETNRQELTYSKDIVARAKAAVITETNISDIEVLPEYLLVKKLVQNNFPMIFITGGAGTGKSTFVKWLLSEFKGTVLLGAPTAAAAVNIEGKTLHSLCQLPPAWIVKTDIKDAPRRREIAEAKLLIIDEISMVTANLLDGVSAFFRLNKKIDKPFGGMTVIMIGDMFQLPPIVNNQTKDLFERIYGSAKFYNAKCLSFSSYYAVELNKTFRQTDQLFVDVLTKIREGIDLEASISLINRVCLITDSPPFGAVWLSPRNVEVDSRNLTELNKIDAPQRMYRGEIEGKFKDDRLPSPMELVLKVGAQVMFTKNDPQRRWINGTIGVVTKLNNDIIVVSLAQTGKLVDVERTKWPEFNYAWAEDKCEITRVEIGCYKQFPLVLAWAMTIHKSQGKTIEKVHLDLGSGSFETGQTYVALSRCRAINGLSMTRYLKSTDIHVDKESKAFYDELRAIIKKLPPNDLLNRLDAASF